MLDISEIASRWSPCIHFVGSSCPKSCGQTDFHSKRDICLFIHVRPRVDSRSVRALPCIACGTRL